MPLLLLTIMLCVISGGMALSQYSKVPPKACYLNAPASIGFVVKGIESADI